MSDLIIETKITYSIFYVSEDGLMKRLKDAWDRYDMLFLEDYATPELALAAIKNAAEQERIEGFYQIHFVILPSVLLKLTR